MRSFEDEAGREWIATAHEEATPRHHGRWYLVFHPADEPGLVLAMPEVRWQTPDTAERTLRTMGEFELRRRLYGLQARAGWHVEDPEEEESAGAKASDGEEIST